VGVELAAAVAWYAIPAGAVMDGLAETLMVPDPAALGVKSKVAAAVPLGVRVVGAKVPEMPVAAGVSTTLDGQAAPVGVTVRVTALPTAPELADRDVVKAVAAAGVGVGDGVGVDEPPAASALNATKSAVVKPSNVRASGAVSEWNAIYAAPPAWGGVGSVAPSAKGRIRMMSRNMATYRVKELRGVASTARMPGLHAIRTSRSAGVSISAGETRRVPFGPVVIVTPRAAKDCTNSAGVTRGRVPACMARCASAATCSCNSFT